MNTLSQQMARLINVRKIRVAEAQKVWLVEKSRVELGVHQCTQLQQKIGCRMNEIAKNKQRMHTSASRRAHSLADFDGYRMSLDRDLLQQKELLNKAESGLQVQRQHLHDAAMALRRARARLEAAEQQWQLARQCQIRRGHKKQELELDNFPVRSFIR